MTRLAVWADLSALTGAPVVFTFCEHRPGGRFGLRFEPIGRVEPGAEGELLVATDARRKEVYWAAYDAEGRRTAGPDVVRPEDLGVSGPFVGNPSFAERLAAPVTAADVTTAGLIRAAAPQLADPSSAGPLVPLYLRRPDATPPTAIKTVSQA